MHSRLAVVAFDVLPSEAVVLGSDGVVLLANSAWRQFGRQNGAGSRCGVGTNYLEVCRRSAAAGDELAGVVEAALTAVLDGHAPRAALDYPCHSPTARRWFHLRARPLPGQRGVLVTHDEVTDRVTESPRHQHDATHDPLTGLANRVLLHDRLVEALTTGDRRRTPDVAVLVIDLDDFKQVNDRHGHLAGDTVLAILARRLETHARAQDTVARWGGDEFVLVLPGCTPAWAHQLSLRLTKALARPVDLGSSRLTVSASIGWAIGRGGQDANDVLEQADAALLAAKTHRGRPGDL